MANRRLNLMHVVFGLSTGGLENGVVNLCNRLEPERYRTVVCVFNGGGAFEARLNAARVELLEVKRHLNNDPTLPFRLAWHLRRRRIDILHTHAWGTLVEGVIAAKLARTPIIVHGEHGTLEERPRNIPVQRALWSRTHQVTAVADPLADRMSQLIGFSRDRIRVIPNGVDTERFRPQVGAPGACRRRFCLPATGLVIGMLARLVPVKNHLGVLRALAQLKAKGIQARLALAGDGPLQNELRQATCDLGIAEDVQFLGDIVDVDTFLNSLDVFVLNSNAEGMSNTILEAMACGLPVVATSVGANPVLVMDGDTGHVVPGGDVDALSDALTSLAADPSKRRTMGHAGRVRIETHLSIRNMVRDYSELYQTLINGVQPAGPDRGMAGCERTMPLTLSRRR